MARTFTAPERAAIALGETGHDIHARLELRDPDGDWIEMTAFASTAWLIDLALEENINTDCQTMSGTLLRETSTLNSLAPLMESSLRNRDNAAAYAPFLDVARQWRAFVAVVPLGVGVVGGDWKEIGGGLYDIIEINSPYPSIQITGRDWGASLLNLFIPEKRRYGNDVTPVPMETVLQQLLDDNLGAGAITLYTPTSPLFEMDEWEQEQMSLMQALNDVADKAAMVVRYRYDAAGVNRLTLYAPDRTAGPGDEVWELGPDEYTNLPLARIDVSGVRNRIEGNYVSDATGKVELVTAEDANSITKYGGPHEVPWLLQIDFAKDTNIRTAARAQAIVDAVLSDLYLPSMEAQYETPGFWIAQLGDYGKFLANTTQYDTDQYGGVTSIRHTLAHGTMRTVISTRGQPAGRYRAWIAKKAISGAPEFFEGISNFYFIDSADGTERTFFGTAGSKVHRVFVFDLPMVAPPTSNPWPRKNPPPGEERLPDAILTPAADRTFSYTTTKPPNGKQRFIQFEPRLESFAEGPVRRAVVDPAQSAVAPKISATITAAYTADLTVDVVAGPADWPVQVDVYEDLPSGVPIYTGTFSANATLDKNTAGASALGGRSIPGRVLRLWWTKHTNAGGQVVWASTSTDRESQPWLESLEMIWEESALKLKARVKGGAFCGSVTIEADDSSTFASPLTAQHFNLADGGDVTAEFTLTQAQRGVVWHARATPFNGALLAGVPTGAAGVAQIAQFPVPVVRNDGTDIPQGTIAISEAGVTRLSVDGPTWVGSYKWKSVVSSDGSVPSEADTLATGTLVNGRVIDATMDTLVLGGKVGARVIPFSAADAAGYQGASIQLRATRHDASATKTVYMGAMAFTPQYDTGAFYEIASGYLKLYNTGSGWSESTGFNGFFVDNFVIPAGCTITTFEAECYSGNNGVGDPDGAVWLGLYRTDTEGVQTLLADFTAFAGTGWVHKTDTCSELASADRRYKVELELSIFLHGGETYARCAGYSYTYTMPSTANSI